MALPTLTDAQRAEALAKAAAARTARKTLLDALKQGETTLGEVLERAETDAVVSRTKVFAVVKALPGVGVVRAAKIMVDAEIADNRRIGGLGSHQRATLLMLAAAVSRH